MGRDLVWLVLCWVPQHLTQGLAHSKGLQDISAVHCREQRTYGEGLVLLGDLDLEKILNGLDSQS